MAASLPRERYRIDDLVLDVGSASVLRGEEPLRLPALSFSTLVLLARRAPDVVTHGELVAEVWQGAAISDETITQRIALLRRALRDSSQDPHYIRSVRGRGYQLVPQVVPDMAPLTAHPTHATGASNPRLRSGVLLGILVMALAVVLLLFLWRGRGSFAPPAQEVQVAAEAPGTTLVSRGMEYMARHREEDNDLAIELFQQALDGDPYDSEALAGLSLAYSQRTTKFNYETRWAEEAGTLAVAAIDQDPKLALAHHALALSLDARSRIDEALASYHRAWELDPSLARSIASAAHLYRIRGDLADAMKWNLRSLEAGADLNYVEIQIAETLALLGFLPQAEGWFRRARQLRPDNLFAHSAFAEFRLVQGDLAGADSLVAEAAERGVERPELLVLQGHLAALRGRPEEAEAAYRSAVELNPRQTTAASQLLARRLARSDHGARQEAQAFLETLDGQSPSQQWPTLDATLLASALGDDERALAELDQAIDLGYRDSAWLLVDPGLADLRATEGFWPRIERIRGLVEEERSRFFAAEWLPEGFLDSQ